MHVKHAGALLAAALGLALGGGPARASSHSDAPLIKQDPQANLTDVYTFLGTNAAGTKVLNVLIAVRPFCEPGDGVVYDRFADDALYSIHIADPASGETVLRYDFRFSAVSSAAGDYKNRNTILSYGRGPDAAGRPDVGAIQDVGDARQNYTQTYTITRTTFERGRPSERVIARGLKVPPANPGKRATPAYNDASGVALNFTTAATTYAGLDRYTRQSVYALRTGESAFAGLREDGFFADAPGIFDLLDPRILGKTGNGQAGNGVDGFKGYNTLSYAIQIPVSQLPSLSYTLPALLGGAQRGVGVYASVSRPRVTLRSPDGDPVSTGPWVQVNRLANPLFNEVLVAIRDKDHYNRTSPTVDARRFRTYANSPEVITLLNLVFSTTFQTTGRADLVAIYIPDVIRVNTTTDVVPLPGQARFNRLGAFGGDTTGGIPSGWPNGRRPGDDVVDIALTAIASGPTYTRITPLGDNINAYVQLFNQVFPYLATPNAGTRNSKDSGPNVGGG
jgi:hypothetical protein